ncbi:DUF4136 domain-containing protein [Flavobacterium sp.]|uniref:DUF4136 domain-containing protein n=1 Tax=Flavobacterium sp. TaxID=239 RepID=UPI003528085B
MKTIKLLSFLLIIASLTSCSSVRVNADYDKKANFGSYHSYAYLKSGVDQAQISDLDKKRILYAIDDVMATKGFSKSENPDVLVSIFTKESERVDVYNNVGFGWGVGWGGPYWGVGYNNVSTTPEGTLFIDFVDAKTKELIWQGQGTGYLTQNVDKKDERIMQFVNKILAQYPPEKK